MGKWKPEGDDHASIAREGVIDAVEAGEWVTVMGEANVTLRGPNGGAFDADIILERSFDGGVTAHPCTSGGEPVVFKRGMSELARAGERGMLYRFRATRYVAGPVSWRISG